MEEAWTAKNELLDRGVPPEFALYLLPNAKAIRLVESGSLLHLLHKWTMRTCFNAQEEIYQSSIEEVEQVRAGFSGAGALHRPALLSARRNFNADLHGRLALLRRESLARLSEYSAAHLNEPQSRRYLKSDDVGRIRREQFVADSAPADSIRNQRHNKIPHK